MNWVLENFMKAGYALSHNMNTPDIWVASCAEWRTTFEFMTVGMN